MLTLVCGFGRCGSSLTMQMLQAGGAPVAGRFPAFELDEMRQIPISNDWLRSLGSVAVKVLDPQRCLAKPFVARIIWLTRDHKQQAKSQVKFMRMLAGVPIKTGAWKVLARSYVNDQAKAIRLFHGLPMLRLSFEKIINHPLDAAKELTAFFPDLSVEAASKAVLKRSPECAPGLDIEMALVA